MMSSLKEEWCKSGSEFTASFHSQVSTCHPPIVHIRHHITTRRLETITSSTKSGHSQRASSHANLISRTTHFSVAISYALRAFLHSYLQRNQAKSTVSPLPTSLQQIKDPTSYHLLLDLLKLPYSQPLLVLDPHSSEPIIHPNSIVSTGPARDGRIVTRKR